MSAIVTKQAEKQNRKINSFSAFDAQELVNQLANQLANQLSAQFSFKESKKAEAILAPHIRPQTELFQMRTILNAAKRERHFRSINSTAAKLANKLFCKFLTLHNNLWLRAIENRSAWLNGKQSNYDSQDLMLKCRKIANRIVLRRLRETCCELFN